MRNILKSSGEFPCGFITEGGGNLRDGFFGLAEQLHSPVNPVFLHVGRDGLAVYSLEEGFQRGGIDQVLSGKLFNGKTLFRMPGQAVMDFPDQLRLAAAVSGDAFFAGSGRIQTVQIEKQFLRFQFKIRKTQRFRQPAERREDPFRFLTGRQSAGLSGNAEFLIKGFRLQPGFPQDAGAVFGKPVQIDGQGDSLITAQRKPHNGIRAAVGAVQREISCSQIDGHPFLQIPAHAAVVTVADLQNMGRGGMVEGGLSGLKQKPGKFDSRKYRIDGNFAPAIRGNLQMVVKGSAAAVRRMGFY